MNNHKAKTITEDLDPILDSKEYSEIDNHYTESKEQYLHYKAELEKSKERLSELGLYLLDQYYDLICEYFPPTEKQKKESYSIRKEYNHSIISDFNDLLQYDYQNPEKSQRYLMILDICEAKGSFPYRNAHWSEFDYKIDDNYFIFTNYRSGKDMELRLPRKALSDKGYLRDFEFLLKEFKKNNKKRKF